MAALSVGVGYAASRMVSGVADTGDELAKMSRQLGLNIKTLQRWQFIANRQGVDQGTLTQSLGAFVKRLGEARAGSGALTTYLKKANPALLEQLKNTTSVTSAFRLYLAALADTPNKADQAAAASAGFSRQGQSLIRLVDGGFPVFDKLANTFDRLKGGISAKDAHAAESFKDALANLATAFQGAKFTVAGRQLNALTGVIKELTRYIVAHHEQIAKWSEQFAEKLPRRIHEAIIAIKSLGRTIRSIVKFVGGWKNAMIGVAAISLAPLAASVLSVAFGLWKVGAAAVSALKKIRAMTKASQAANAAAGGVGGPVARGAPRKPGVLAKLGRYGARYGKYALTGIGSALVAPEALVAAAGGAAIYGSWKLGSYIDRKRVGVDDSRRRADRLTRELMQRRKEIAAARQGEPLMLQSAQNAPNAGPVRGSIHIKVDSEGRARVESVESEGPVDLDVDSGPLIFGH